MNARDEFIKKLNKHFSKTQKPITLDLFQSELERKGYVFDKGNNLIAIPLRNKVVIHHIFSLY